MNSSILQSIIAINAKQIDATNMFYQSYKDMMKNMRETGTNNDEKYSKFKKSADKELKRLHMFERNQRALLQELKEAYVMEDYERLCKVYLEDIYG